MKLKDSGFSRKQFQKFSQKNQFDLSFGVIDYDFQTTYGYKWCKIPNLNRIDCKDFSFLSDVAAPKGWCYLYAVYDKKNHVIKLGQTKKLFKRLKEHIRAFNCYAKTESKDLGCLFSRNPFPLHINAEKELLKSCKDKYPQVEVGGNEFFFANNKTKWNKIMNYMIEFLEQHPENL